MTSGAPADQARRAGWRRMAILGTALVAGATAVGLVAFGGLPSLSGPVGTSTLSPDASAMGTPTASEPAVPPSLDGLGFAFWTLDQVAPCCGSTLRISTSTGSWEGVIEIPDAGNGPQFPVPAGPAEGRVLYVVDDGRTARLLVQDAWTGDESELTSTALVIAQLAMDPTGSTAYYLLFERGMSDFRGLWAISTEGGQPRPLIAAQATLAVARLAAEPVYPAQLAVSDDGRWIVFVSCQPTACDFHAIRPDGTSEPMNWSNFRVGDSVIGIAADVLIGSSECGLTTCDGFTLDLRTGVRLPLGGANRPFAPRQLIAGPHGPLILGEINDFDAGLWTVEALDLTTGARSSAFEATFEPGVTTVRLARGWYPAAAELPPGWFLIYRNTDAEAFLPPDYSAAMVGALVETKLPFMESSQP